MVGRQSGNYAVVDENIATTPATLNAASEWHFQCSWWLKGDLSPGTKPHANNCAKIILAIIAAG